MIFLDHLWHLSSADEISLSLLFADLLLLLFKLLHMQFLGFLDNPLLPHGQLRHCTHRIRIQLKYVRILFKNAIF